MGTNVQMAGTNVQNSIVNALIERDARLADLQRQVRELQQHSNARGPPPRIPTVPAAMGNSGVLQAAGPTEATPGVIPDSFGLQSKAPRVQSRRPDGNSEDVRAKFHGAPEPSPLYRDPAIRLSPAYSEPDKGIWGSIVSFKSFSANEG